MDLAAAGLREQPFRTHGKPLATIAYRAHEDALEMLEKTRRHPRGFSLLQGPSLSGKSTLIREFVENLPEECVVAIVDSTGLRASSLQEALLRQFGFDIDFSSSGELSAMLRVYALQQASTREPPIVIIENAHAMNPSALRALGDLAELKVRFSSALKFILTSDRPLRTLVDTSATKALRQRLVTDFHLRPMSCDEASTYIRDKLLAAGADVPEFVFPISVCNELWHASGGWPGILDRVALLALSKATTLPVDAAGIERPVVPAGTWTADSTLPAQEDSGEPPAQPMLYLTQNGKTIKSFVFDKPRLLIGRSEHNDLSINSRFVSRHHLLLVRSGSSTILMDLNSTNGTFVNSRRVSNHLLVDSDIIAIGHHRIKFCDPHATRRKSLDTDRFADTAIMKTLEDMRDLLSGESTTTLPVPSEDVPTLGG